MKKQRFIFSMMVCILLLFSLTACSARTPVTPETFKSVMEEAGYTVEDKSSTATGTEGAEIYYVCTNDSDDKAFFLGFGNKDDSYNFYNTLKEGMTQNSPDVKTVIESDAYCRYACAVGDTTHMIVRVEDTIVYVTGPSSNKAAMDELFKKMGY